MAGGGARAPAGRGVIRFTWVVPPSRMGQDCQRRAREITPALAAGAAPITSDMQSYAQDNAPWTDRTGAARSSLSFQLEQRGTGIVIIGRHGVPYGGYLETGTSHMSPYPIIRPTLQAHYAEVRALMNQIAGSG
jgi:HK97 gp10 family phage protein